MVATRESVDLAKLLLFDTIEKQKIRRDHLAIHSDNDSSMASKPVAFLLTDFGVTKSHSRPHTSNDNPFSESHFKTLKYRPEFPTGSIASPRRAHSAPISTAGTTLNIVIRASECKPLSTATTAVHQPFSTPVPAFSRPPIPSTPNAS